MQQLSKTSNLPGLGGGDCLERGIAIHTALAGEPFAKALGVSWLAFDTGVVRVVTLQQSIASGQASCPSTPPSPFFPKPGSEFDCLHSGPNLVGESGAWS